MTIALLPEEPFREIGNTILLALLTAVPYVTFYSGIGVLSTHQIKLINDELMRNLLK